MALASLVTSASLVRVLLARWYITVPGIILSLALAAAAYVLFPPQYASRATIMLVQPSEHGKNSLLTLESSVNTTAQIIVQAMNAPQMPRQLGVADGQEKFTVTNGNTDLEGKVTEASGPFITIMAQSPSPGNSTAIVNSVLARAKLELKNLQSTLKVRSRNNITTTTVVEATPPKPVWDKLLRTMGIAVLIGSAITLGLVCAVDRMATRARARRSTKSVSPPAPEAMPTADMIPHNA